jgi:scyllo-inositol 2-dehydrogenase (NADP+)
MIKVGVVGLGKMGISHLAAFRAHPEVDLVGVCDTSRYLRDVLGKYTGLRTFGDLEAMVDATGAEALVVATPSHLHERMVRTALERDLHVFCEKPFCLDPAQGAELAALAARKGLVTQVGYHNRFVAAFAEVRRLLDAGAIGRVTHVLAEAYGPVVLKPSGSTWRTRKTDGGGCLYDYAAHPIDLLTWYFGDPLAATGSVLSSVFSAETDDEVVSTLHFAGPVTAQVSVSWSDESERKMSTKLTLWGTQGRIMVDRQDVMVFLRDGAAAPAGYRPGWNVKYTTDLTDPVWYYLRGEEYSAQVDHFVRRAAGGEVAGTSTFEDAVRTDRALAMIVADAAGEGTGTPVREQAGPARRRWWHRLDRRRPGRRGAPPGTRRARRGTGDRTEVPA